jgi:uncharacterized SAM-binding protein YcdF (DUF218 family)
MEWLVGVIKALLIPGTLTFLLFGLTLGVLLGYGPPRARRFAWPFITTLVAAYWIGSVPVLADLLGTRFHAHEARQVTFAEISDAKAVVVLGAGIRTSYVAGGQSVAIPDPQTVYNAVEAARIYHLFPDGLAIIASGGRQNDATGPETESVLLKEWLMKAGVPADRILLESGSRNTREQAQKVAPLLKANHWERFALVAPAVQEPRACAVFRREGVDPIAAAAPFWSEADRQHAPGWLPNTGALRATERAMYDYLAWAYYWLRGWLR